VRGIRIQGEGSEGVCVREREGVRERERERQNSVFGETQKGTKS
jgi:hypothetical protein